MTTAQGQHLRRLAVILHADVADSTTLVRLNESLVHDRITHAFNKFTGAIERYGGTVREVRGDALVAEFDRASDAVCASIDFQHTYAEYIKELEDEISPTIRVGVSLGEVIIADDTITGEGVVLAQRIEQLAIPGGLCITAAIHEALPKRMPFDKEDLGDRELKGFDEPVRVYRVELKAGESIPPPDLGAELSRNKPDLLRLRWAIASTVSLIATVVGLLIWLQPWHTKQELKPEEVNTIPSTGKPFIAVLPFNNLSDDPKQEYFSDGISEDIITDLSQISNLGVIGRNSSFAYKDATIKIQNIGKELGVGYVLEGSVRKVGERMRITAQLVETMSGQSLWAERYDRQLVDIFKLQDEIRNNIVSALSIQLVGEETEQLSQQSTKSFEAYDLFLKGRQAYKELSVESLEEAVSLYRQAIEHDPKFARAYGGIGMALSDQSQIDFITTDHADLLDQALDAAEKAVSIDPSSPQVQWALGYVQMSRQEFEKASEAVEIATALAPNYADAWGLLALINNQLGRGEQALRFIRKGMMLDPRYTWEYLYNEGRALYTIGDYEKAVEPLLEALDRNEYAFYPRLFLAATYSRLNRLDDAAWEATQLEVMNPGLSISSMEKISPISDGEHRDRFFGDLRKAGLPE